MFRGYTIPLLFFISIGGCTTSSWVIDEEPVRYPPSETILSERPLFLPVQMPEPHNPLLKIKLMTEREITYDRHLVSKRHIQKYRPSYGYLIPGLGVMGFGLYLANFSDQSGSALSGRDRVIINICSFAMGMASIMAMKPSDEPRDTGEYRFLQKKDTVITKDTLDSYLSEGKKSIINLKMGKDRILSNKEISFEDNVIAIRPLQHLNIQKLEKADTASLTIGVSYDGLVYEQTFPIETLMKSYVQTTSSEVPLRASPVRLDNNIVRHVPEGSRFMLLNEIDDRWYRVYGYEEPAYLPIDQARKIWLSADAEEADFLASAAGDVVFGDLSIERNLPDNRRAQPEGIAVIILNGAYSAPVKSLPHASRTAKLATLYANRVLGYYLDHILVFENMTHSEMTRFFQESDSLQIGNRQLSMDESDIFFYYYGHALRTDDGSRRLLPIDYDPDNSIDKSIPLEQAVNTLSQLRIRNKVAVWDTDFCGESPPGETEVYGVRPESEALREISQKIIQNSVKGGVFWAAQEGQYAGAYSRNQGDSGSFYDIFSWYFFEALQQGAQSAGEIETHIERNVSFTSRRLHERAQDPLFEGDRDLVLIE